MIDQVGDDQSGSVYKRNHDATEAVLRMAKMLEKFSSDIVEVKNDLIAAELIPNDIKGQAYHQRYSRQEPVYGDGP